jgi:hypothetical protein
MTTPVNPGSAEGPPVPSGAGEGPAGGTSPGPGEAAPGATPDTPASSGGFGAMLASFFQAILRPLRSLGGGKS